MSKIESDEIVLIVQPPETVNVIVEDKVVLPVIEVQTPGLQGAKGDKGDMPTINNVTKQQIDNFF